MTSRCRHLKSVELYRVTPHARLELIDGPHMILLERPREFTAPVHRHLRWVDERLTALHRISSEPTDNESAPRIPTEKVIT